MIPVHRHQIQPRNFYYNPNYSVTESCGGYSDPKLLLCQENKILRHVHRHVMDHNIWYLFIEQSIVWNSKPLFYQYVVPLCLRNMFFWICIINLYSHLIAHFIHNLFKLTVTCNAFNRKSWFVVVSNYYTQSLVALFLCYIGKWN